TRPPILTLFPYTTLFRSSIALQESANLSCLSIRPLRAKPVDRDVFSPNDALRYEVDSRGCLETPVVGLWRRIQYGSRKRRADTRSEEHTSELQSRGHLVC